VIGMLAVLITLNVLVVLLVVVYVMAWLDDGEAAARRWRNEQRAREAEREIDEIGRQTQEAIMAEALRRARNKRPDA
jgi:hypothetical protein